MKRIICSMIVILVSLVSMDAFAQSSAYYARKANEYHATAESYRKEARQCAEKADACYRDSKKHLEAAARYMKDNNMIMYNAEKRESESALSNRSSYVSRANYCVSQAKKYDAAAADAIKHSR